MEWRGLLTKLSTLLFLLLFTLSLFAQPVITSFSPAEAGPGTSVTITGSNLHDVTAVHFGGKPAARFSIVSATTITAEVARQSASGVVEVFAPGGAGSLGGFTYTVPPPVITSITPYSAQAFQVITIHGSNFEEVEQVMIGHSPVVQMTVISPTELQVTVPPLVNDPNLVSVRTKYGEAFSRDFHFIPFPPEVDSVAPKSGPPGTLVTVYGRNLEQVVYVDFGGVQAAGIEERGRWDMFKARVGTGATGKVTVHTPGGMVEFDGFTVTAPLAPPVISSFSPAATTQWETVVIHGANFTAATGVYFGGHAGTFIVDSDTKITARTGLTGASGDVTVFTPTGSDTLGGYTWIVPAPRITAVNPSSAGPGTEITISGYNFQNTTAVSFGGNSAASFHVENLYTIKAIVRGGNSGDVAVATPGGIGTFAGFNYTNALWINTFAPAAAGMGKVVEVYGAGFTGATGVTFGGTVAASFTVVADTMVRATIGNGASGDVTIQTPSGTKSIAGFTYLPPPSIQTFSPAGAVKGATVTLQGSGFTGATAVTFGNTAAASFTVISDNEIQAVVGNGSSGDISVQTPQGAQSIPGFTFMTAPVITSFTPASGGQGTVVTINGSDFTDVISVSFGNSSAQAFTVESPGKITATVGNGKTGAVKIITAAGEHTYGTFTYTPKPVITSFSPTSYAQTTGGPVTIRGSGFTSATAVYFGGTQHSALTVESDTIILASPGSGSSGHVKVVTPYGRDSMPGFIYSYPPLSPTIRSFTPATGGNGTVVTIIGSNFSAVNGVEFGSVPAASFTIVSPDTIRAVVGTGASGLVSVKNANGYAHAGEFHYGTYTPVIHAFAPTEATSGTVVRIKGANFTGITAVSFGGVPAVSFTMSGDSLWAVVGEGASGELKVVNADGTATLGGFIYIPSARSPVIHSFSPVSGGPGATITIQGENLIGVHSVQFGGVPAALFNVLSPTAISAKVGAGASGGVAVVSNAGADTLAGFTFIPQLQTPIIKSYSPASGTTGTVITITGNNFDSIRTVTFGGVPAASFTILSSDTIRAIVGAGASGIVKVEGPGGAHMQPGFVYVPPVLQPTIKSFFPSTGGPGSIISITGSNLSAVTAVSFGGEAAASFSIISDTTIQATVDSGATGDVAVTNAAGTASKAGFTYLFKTPPSISSFSPQSGPQGTVVVIKGQNFTSYPQVWFGGVQAASVTVGSSSYNEIRAVVAPGVPGDKDIIVSTTDGADTVTGFKLLPFAPVITSFTPQSGSPGTVVVIKGAHFIGSPAVWFGNQPAAQVQLKSNTEVWATVGTAGASGNIILQADGGRDTVPGFTFLPPPVAPVIQSFAPQSGGPGTVVVIKGERFTGNPAVWFGNQPAAQVQLKSNTEVWATVGTAGASGNIILQADGGRDTIPGFTFLPPPVAPVIQSFAPQSGGPGTVVVIRGERFGGSPVVWFGNAPAALLQIVSENEIRATVGAAGETGSVIVQTNGGRDTMPGFTFIAPPRPPEIVSFSPASAAEGEVVTILGHNFSNITDLKFGNVPSPSFSVLSEEKILATVGNGASGHIWIRTSAGADTAAGFVFVQRPPVISSFAPQSGGKETVVTIFGGNFKAVRSVSFGGMPAITFTVKSNDTIIAVVGNGATGPVSVTDPNGTAVLPGFTYTMPDTELDGFPNPAVDYVRVNHPVSAAAQIQIRDISGNLVRTQTPDSSTGNTRVDLQGLKGGYYRIVWTNGSTYRSMAVILQR